jgi:hypothetical protein
MYYVSYSETYIKVFKSQEESLFSSCCISETTMEVNDAVANLCWVNKTVILNIGFALYYMQSHRKI